MLYSIIPPILIVLSLIGIIVIIVRKSSKVAHIIEAEARQEELEGRGEEKVGFFRRWGRSFKKIPWSRLKFFFLGILEKIMKFFRTIFFSLGENLGRWSSNIREKRRQRQTEKMAAPKRTADGEEDILEKIRGYKIEQRINSRSSEEETVVETAESVEIEFDNQPYITKENKNETVIKVADEEKIIKPMISDRVVSPQWRSEIKDRLEELLIERIAANPKDIEAYERLGEYYMEIKSYEFAKECFKQVIKLDPLNRNVKYKMRRLEHLLSR